MTSFNMPQLFFVKTWFLNASAQFSLSTLVGKCYVQRIFKNDLKCNSQIMTLTKLSEWAQDDLWNNISPRRSNMLRILLLYWKQDGCAFAFSLSQKFAKDCLEKHVFLKVFIKVRNLKKKNFFFDFWKVRFLKYLYVINLINLMFWTLINCFDLRSTARHSYFNL